MSPPSPTFWTLQPILSTSAKAESDIRSTNIILPIRDSLLKQSDDFAYSRSICNYLLINMLRETKGYKSFISRILLIFKYLHLFKRLFWKTEIWIFLSFSHIDRILLYCISLISLWEKFDFHDGVTLLWKSWKKILLLQIMILI